VPEVSRELITSNRFTISDIVRTGREQNERVQQLEARANRLLICDTDLITTQIYSRIYLGVVPEILFELEREITYDRYFLFDIDVRWVADGLRDLNDRRVEVFHMFKDELVKRNIDYFLVSGGYENREQTVRQEIDRILAS
jgi:HTH-type transcriptional repressor of NAD biosynthesis genes